MKGFPRRISDAKHRFLQDIRVIPRRLLRKYRNIRFSLEDMHAD